MRDSTGFKYFLSDHLGSTSVVLDANGGILKQQRYLPFGQAWVMPPYASATSTDFTYTGQRNPCWRKVFAQHSEESRPRRTLKKYLA
ncbi:MAG: hypothetical protein JW730_18580 [Anaerolineales bacterium]|nr:hypothetical protein [Anaerolineales bacterium]